MIFGGFWCPYWDPLGDVFRTFGAIVLGRFLAWFGAPCFVGFSWISVSCLVTFWRLFPGPWIL